MKSIIKINIICLLCCLTTGLFIEAKAQQVFDKAVFYKVMENGKLDAVEEQMKIILSAQDINKDAYSGALIMKKAGLVKGPSKKLSVFKEGHKKLEAVIKADAA
ncbi:MAG: hypothetical protein ABUT20_59610, partial [Bacteroidota bacterium]